MTVSPVEVPFSAPRVQHSAAVDIVALPPTDALYLHTATRQIAGDYPHDTGSLLDAAAGLCARLPGGLLDRLHRFRRHEDATALVIRDLRVNDTAIGPTPTDWRHPIASHHEVAVRAHEVFLLLVASALGDVFGWTGQQNGRVVHDVLPTPGDPQPHDDPQPQSRHGTVAPPWHTEDASPPCRPDFVLLLGLRNHAKVPTTVASVRDVMLDPRHRTVLTERRFLIRPDTEHVHRTHHRTATRDEAPQPTSHSGDQQPSPVLYGPSDTPYLRTDPTFITAQPGDEAAAEALTALTAALNRGRTGVTLRPGDLLIINNHTAVHSSSDVHAVHDGTGRWLKKAVVTRDLRRAYLAGHTTHDRVLN